MRYSHTANGTLPPAARPMAHRPRSSEAPLGHTRYAQSPAVTPVATASYYGSRGATLEQQAAVETADEVGPAPSSAVYLKGGIRSPGLLRPPPPSR